MNIRSYQFKNIISNYSGQIWTAVVNIFCVPFYISALGLEQYGLISIFILLQSLLPLLDLGLGNTLIRQISHTFDNTNLHQHKSNLLRTTEIIFLFIAALIFLLVQLNSSRIAGVIYLNASSLPFSLILSSVKLMGVLLSTRLLESLYRSVFIGSSRHLSLNLYLIIRTSVGAIGVLLVFAYFGDSAEVYLKWNLLVTLLSTLYLASSSYRILQISWGSGVFSWRCIYKLKNYSLSMAILSLVAIVFTQFDKLVLVRVISIQEFAVYSVAFTLANSLTLLVSPITISYFPVFCRHIATKQRQLLSHAFHMSSQMVSVVASSSVFTVFFSAYPLLLFWTKDPVIAAQATLVFQFLVLATLCNSLVSIPYQLQLAYGWTSLSIKLGISFSLLFVPGLILVARSNGPLGVSLLLFLFNILIMLISTSLMFRKILRQQSFSWFFLDVLLPLASSLLVSFIFSCIFRSLPSGSIFWLLPQLLIAFTCALLCSLYFSSKLRPYVFP